MKYPTHVFTADLFDGRKCGEVLSSKKIVFCNWKKFCLWKNSQDRFSNKCDLSNMKQKNIKNTREMLFIMWFFIFEDRVSLWSIWLSKKTNEFFDLLPPLISLNKWKYLPENIISLFSNFWIYVGYNKVEIKHSLTNILVL